MKKLSTLVMTLFLTAGLALAQTGGDKSALNPKPLPPGKKATTTGKTTQTKSGKKGHKAGAKSKKNSGGSTTPPPK
jgi:hypothetical protein